MREKGKVLQIDGETLLKNPELLSRAMYSAVVSNNIAGIRVILPIYLQQAQQDKMLALYAQGILAQAEGRVEGGGFPLPGIDCRPTRRARRPYAFGGGIV